MPRKIRVQYPGAIYHVMSRGDRRENIFLDDVDRHDFIRTLAEACQKTGFQVHAYCLMPNHFHLVVETPNANLVDGMRWLLSAYTKAGRIIAEELRRLRRTSSDLKLRLKSDPAKLQIAARLRAETTLPIHWIAQRLHLGTWKSANARIYTWKKAQTERKPSNAMF